MNTVYKQKSLVYGNTRQMNKFVLLEMTFTSILIIILGFSFIG